MPPRRCLLGLRGLALSALGLLLLVVPASAADHADTPFLMSSGRHDARLTDLFAFTSGDRLVLALCTNPAIPGTLASYRFPSDLELRIHLDVTAKVESGATMVGAGKHAKHAVVVPGGVLLEPHKVKEEVLFSITFDKDGAAEVDVKTRKGISAKAIERSLRVFAGLRDDPFIRTGREGKNVAAVVLEVPLALVLDEQATLLAWATSRVKGLKSDDGKTMDMAAQPLSSQFEANMAMNFEDPADQYKKLGRAPDVLLFDTSKPAGWPNGRALADDVVDLVLGPSGLSGEDPANTANDVPFLPGFPYLAPPHAP